MTEKAIVNGFEVNRLICGDCFDVMSSMPDNFVTLIFTSPPYDLSLNYGNHKDNMPWQEYLDWLKAIWTQCKRILRPGGRLAINIDVVRNRDDSSEYMHFICYYLTKQMKEIGLLPFTEIAWYKQNVVGRKTAWGSYNSPSLPIIRRVHEYIYVYSKDQFRLEGDLEQSDLEPEEFEKWTLSTWFINPETRSLANHPAVFPEELARRAIKLWTYRDDVVLDPFVGTGTTVLMAKRLSRKYIGIDKFQPYIDYAEQRLSMDYDAFADDNVYIPKSERLKKRKMPINKEIGDCFDW